MNYCSKVTLNPLFVAFLLVSLSSFGQSIIPEKSGETWMYKNESTNQVLVKNLEVAEPYRNGIGIAQKDGKWGAFDVSMKEVIPFKYEALEMIAPRVLRGFNDRLFDLYNVDGVQIFTKATSAVHSEKIPNAIVISNEDRKYGLISSDGKSIIPIKYAGAPNIMLETDLSFYLEKKGKFYKGILDENGKTIVPFKYFTIKKYGTEAYQGVYEDERRDYYDRSGKLIYQSESKDVRFLMPNFFVSEEKEYKKITILSSKKEYQHQNYQWRPDLIFGQDSLETTVYSAKGKLFKKKGSWNMNEIRNGIIYVTEGGQSQPKSALWDMKGKEIMKATPMRLLDWSEKWAIGNEYANRRKVTLIDLANGKVAGVYDKVEILTCDNLRVLVDGKTQLLDINLNEIPETASNKPVSYYYLSYDDLKNIKRSYTSIAKRSFEEVFEDHKSCDEIQFSNEKLQNVRLINDDYAKQPIPNRLVVSVQEDRTRKQGMVNFQGKVIVPCEYAFIGAHHNGLIEFGLPLSLELGSKIKVGVMDMEGNIILPATYDEITEMRGDTAIVKHHGLYSIINIKTKETYLEGYRHLRFQQNELSLSVDGKYGIAQWDGKIIVPAIYDQVSKKDEFLYVTMRDKVWYYVDKNGKEYLKE